MYDVITIGSNTVDVFVYTDRSQSIFIKTKSDEESFICYPVGAKLLINDLHFFSGGGGTNSAVALSRLGLKTAYIGKVGNDQNGLRILDELKKEKVDFLGPICHDTRKKTGYSVILDSLEKKRTVLSYKGANNYLDYSEIDPEKVKTKWFYISSMMGGSFLTIEKMAEFASKNNIKILFNVSNYLAEKGKGYLKKILENTEILVLNKEEAELLVGRGEPRELASSLKELGPEIVVVTDEENPVYSLDNKNIFYKAIPYDVKVVEATGAGDSFASSFLAGMIKTGDMEFSLRLAIVNSHSVLLFKGAKRRLLKYKQALVEIDRRNIVVEKKKRN
ncbi:MAG: carbohydrate kinase family protein [Actinomycetota bacterium]